MRKVGKVRIKLAEKLNELFPDWHFNPHDLYVQNPAYNNEKWDCCTWWGDGKLKNTDVGVHVFSYNTMAECTKSEIKVGNKEDWLRAEVSV